MKRRVIMDLVFYLCVPLLTWNLCRNLWGDYLTILLGMLPAVIYTLTMFVASREWNVTGVFFLSIISLNFVANLLSHNATQELWNGVWMGCASILFYSITILVKRPIGLYFFIDYAFARGVPREESRALYCSPKHFHHFIKFTLFLCARELVAISIKSVMIKNMGIEGFNAIQVSSTVLNYVFTALMIYYVIYIVRQVAKDKLLTVKEST